MMKRLPAFPFFLLAAGGLLAQDMPPLPPLPNQNQAATQAPATAASTDNSQQALPPLPSQGQAATQGPAGSPATAASDNGQAALPPLPGQPASQAESATPESTPSPEPASTPAAETPVATPEKSREALKPWQASQHRPNVIFGGWVRAKGGNVVSRMAWTSQEVLNALINKKYRLISPDEGKPEEGSYEGQAGPQWRKFTFKEPHTQLAVEVYIRQDAHKKVWLRVGPAEGIFPAETALPRARQIREADLAALHILQKKFGSRLSPNRLVASWEAPYRYSEATADN